MVKENKKLIKKFTFTITLQQLPQLLTNRPGIFFPGLLPQFKKDAAVQVASLIHSILRMLN